MHIFHELQLPQCKLTTTTSVQCLTSGVETIAPKRGHLLKVLFMLDAVDDICLSVCQFNLRVSE